MAPSRVRSRLRRLAARDWAPRAPPPTGSPRRAAAPPPAEDPLEGLPPLQPGRGETPGPNDKRDISQEWASAQLHSGVPPVFVDIRPEAHWAAGHIPGAISAPSDELEELLARLPAKTERVAVYCADGERGSVERAAWLREQGWALTRRLVGGFEAWRAGGEDIEVAEES